ncbi:PilZ domain-containing protein [Fundidesulfovibrio terrae]|uniref:PilZ domain-containing protein n=1 Tax=Fundidesulfovibrio terrae TaxID=2922866 RepID=UPI001FAEF4DC|nr:PilZ domain-containing protein [Fundidesulfovibrio terrae]
MTLNKRKRSRVDTGFDAVVSCGGIEKHNVKVRNLSLKGMLCEPDHRIECIKDCSVTIVLSRSISFTIEARMIRNDEKGLALDFESMDEKAFFHLRNIVRYHSLDPDAIDKELSLPAFKPRT